MKNLFICILLISSFCSAQELSQLRADYPKANEDESVTEKLHTLLSSVSKTDNMTMVAFKGAVLTLKAKYASGFRNKKGFFKEGAELLEFAIASEPKNIEIRCIRLGVQENAPRIVGYKKNIATDKQFIIDHYKSITSPEIKNFVKDYVVLSDGFSDSEKQLF